MPALNFDGDGFSIDLPSGPPIETPPVETPPVETITPPVETPPIETPPVETPPVQTPPIEVPPVETPVVVTPPVETPPVETPPAPIAAPPAPVEPPKPVYADPLIELLNDHIANGGDVRELLAQQLVDHDATPAQDLALGKLRREFPKASEPQLKAMFNKRYTLDEDTYDEEDVLLAQMQLDKDADDERAVRKADQAKIKLPAARQVVEDQAAAKQQWQTSVAPIAASVTQLSLGIKDVATPVAVAVTNRAFETAVLSPETVFDLWKDPATGQSNVKAFAEDIALLQNKEAVFKSIFEAGVRSVAAAINKPTPTGGEPTAPVGGGSAKNDQDEIFEGIRAARAARGY